MDTPNGDGDTTNNVGNSSRNEGAPKKKIPSPKNYLDINFDTPEPSKDYRVTSENFGNSVENGANSPIQNNLAAVTFNDESLVKKGSTAAKS
ncbi:hypothetical protein AYI69_g9529, partial [Smittium culicis]